MARSKELSPARLSSRLDPARCPFESSRDAPPPTDPVRQQPRAVHAFELGLSIAGQGYHICLAGQPGLGRSHFAHRLLASRAAEMPTPPDALYVCDFDDPDRPRLLYLPAGMGRAFRNDMASLAQAVGRDLPSHLDQEAVHARRESLRAGFEEKRGGVYADMERRAREAGFTLSLDSEQGLSITPRGDEGDRPTGEEQHTRRTRLLSDLARRLRLLQAEERDLREALRDMEREEAAEALDRLLAPLREAYADFSDVLSHLEAARAHVLDSLDDLLPSGEESDRESAESVTSRLEANLFVDNAETSGAPIIEEEHPTFFNLLGCIEREAEMGALSTDFSLVKAGSLHRANHGFLILDAEDVLASPAAWDGLLRALRWQKAGVEDPTDHDAPRTRTVRPRPVDLDLKVVLICGEEALELLLHGEQRFRRLFKARAHMQSDVARSARSIKDFLRETCQIARDLELLSFPREALAALADFSSRLAGHQKRLSLEYPAVRDLLVEADALARAEGLDTVPARIIARAQELRDFRDNLIEEEFLEDYDKEIIKVPTTGSAVGRVNGLTVTGFGDYVFGLPHQIACTVGVGEGGIIDLEREAELGGPIHTKAMLILKSYLLGRFATDKPIVLAGSLYFEQSYANVEGDSASGAELAALLSALSQVPVDLSLAFTGAVNQSGAIMAVGSVTNKIEGFFSVCRRRGLTGSQGVLIPSDNVDDLMLKPEVVQAVRDKTFHIHPVRTIEEAMTRLTGRSTRSLMHRVDTRLAALAETARAYRN